MNAPVRARRDRLGELSLQWSPRVVVITSLVVSVIVAVGLFAVTTGTLPVAVHDAVLALVGVGDDTTVRVVRDLRLPRFITGALVGACLGMSGATFQSLTRNPLGSPDVIGFTTGAATGAIVQIIVFGGDEFAVGASAVIGGVACALVVYGLSYRNRATGGYRLVLVGIGVGAMLHAVNSMLLTRSDADIALSAQVWLSGSLNVRTWDHVVPLALGGTVLVPVLLFLQRRLSLMEMGDDAARQLGIGAEATRLASLAAAVALAALAVAATGPIAFVALAAAPLVRGLTRHAGPALGSAATMGALLLTASDLLVQAIPWDYAVPVGVMTGLLGGVYLAWLLGRSTA